MGQPTSAFAAELVVCQKHVGDCTHRSIAGAAAAARDGDTILLRAGIYEEAAVLSANRLTLRAEPGAHMRGAAVEGKAALVVKGDDILIEGLECSEINVVNGNGACIRMEGRNLTLRRIYFHDSQEGILVGSIGRAEKGRLLIEDSRFERLGFGGRAHAIYVGARNITFEIRRSRVVASKGQGHEIKSRAARTLIEGNVIASLEGADSRLVDVPNGGEVVIRDNLFQKGPNSQNPDLIAVGLERGKPGRSNHAVNSILIEGNTFILERGHRMDLVHTKDVPPPVLRRNTIIGGLPYREGDNRWYRDLAAAGFDRPGALLPAAPERAPASVDELFNFVEQQLRRTVSDVSVSRLYPRALRPGNSWHVVDAKDWTSGFFPGAMWLLYQATGKTLWRDWAKAWTAGLTAQRANKTTHDIGFIIGTSFGHGYRITGDAAYRQVIMTAARTLASRYSPTVGAIRSWDWGRRWRYPVIIDNMMNLGLLFEATRLGGPKAWRDIAIAHARRTMAEHMRADGSVYQLVDFDPATGAVLTKGTYQGHSDESAWSRGQAWAIYGFTAAYRETGDDDFLSAARRAADFYIAHLPDDFVPYWDFRAPNIPKTEKDSAAAAIAASALLELGALVPDERVRARYRDIAKRTLQALASPNYLALGSLAGGILRHGAGHRPARNEVDVSLIYGDYYFIEALIRLNEASLTLAFAPPVAAPRKTVAGKATTKTEGAKLTSTEMRAKAVIGAGAPVSLGTADSRLEIDAEASIVRWRGAPITLSPLELALLRTLVEGIGDAVPAPALLRAAKRIEPDAAEGKGLRLVRETIVSLRRKFRDVDRGFTAIAVSPGLGYLWVKER